MFDLQSFLSGLALGLAGKPLALAREPVAYLYNGVRLPKFPECDLPYAYLTYIHSENHGFPYWIWFTANPAHKNQDGYWITGTPNAHAMHYEGWANIWGWGTLSEDAETSYSMFDETIDKENPNSYDRELIWCNHDVTYPDGTVFMAASEPVPVYE